MHSPSVMKELAGLFFTEQKINRRAERLARKGALQAAEAKRARKADKLAADIAKSIQGKGF